MLWQVYFALMPALWLFWRYGLTAPAGALQPVALPDSLSLFVVIFSLTTLLGAAVVAPVVPLGIALIFAIVRRVFFRERKTPDQPVVAPRPRRPLVTSAADSASTDSVAVTNFARRDDVLVK